MPDKKMLQLNKACAKYFLIICTVEHIVITCQISFKGFFYQHCSFDISIYGLKNIIFFPLWNHPKDREKLQNVHFRNA